MRRRSSFSIRPKHLLIGSVILCFVLIFVSFRFSEEIAPVKTTVGNVIAPMQNGINQIGYSISSQFSKFTTMSKLLEENARLKEQLDATSYENKMLWQDKYELDRLRDLYELDKKYADYPKVAARVISVDPNNWYYTFSINKGSKDGIAVGMNVIAGNGLVGIIEEVDTNYSKVRTIINDDSYVNGMFLKTSDNCFIRGDLQLYDNGVIAVEQISKDADIKDGYEVVTSHNSDKYLQGILIGYVSDIKLDASGLTKTAYLRPAVNFERLQEVLIITELKEAIVIE
jgi:rod shape-determining protein MreC